jgi:hypothetical protein
VLANKFYVFNSSPHLPRDGVDGNGNPEMQLPGASSQFPVIFTDNRQLANDDWFLVRM